LLVTACLGALTSAQVVAAQGSVVRGGVVDENGKPVRGATVTFVDHDNDRSYSSESGDDGTYLIVVRPGAYEITVEKEGYRGARFQRQFRRTDGVEVPTVEIVSAESLMAAAVGELNAKFARAAELAVAGELDEAQAIFEALLEERPELVDVHYNLGLLLLRKEEPQKAIAAFERTLELRPDHAPAAVALAGAYEDGGRSDEATALVERVTAENPDDAAIQIDAAYVHLNANRAEQARPLLERALALQPENAEVHYLLGTVVARSGEFAQAVEHLERFLELAPQDDRYREPAETMLPQLQELLAARETPEQ
jgi:tetratricopeptide (TPR) repeat protein